LNIETEKNNTLSPGNEEFM